MTYRLMFLLLIFQNHLQGNVIMRCFSPKIIFEENDPYHFVMLVFKIISLTYNLIKKEHSNSYLYFETSVIQSKSMEYHK